LKLTLDEPGETDEVHTINGFKYIINHELMQQVENVFIEFLDVGWHRSICVVSENPIGK